MATESHVPYELLKPESQDMAKALQSLIEELEAVDWYGQRMDAAHDDELRRILGHHRDEEKEHAAMLLEWIRRRDPAFDGHLRDYLFTSGDLLELEEAATGSANPAPADMPAPTSLPLASESAEAAPPFNFTVGSLRPKRS